MIENASTTDWQTQPVTPKNFEGLADVINTNRRNTHYWCLSHRLGARVIEKLGDGSRETAMHNRLCEREHPTGVLR